MFVEDRSTYFRDFGVLAQFGNLRATVVFDQPDHDALSGRVTTTNYVMTFEASAFPGISHGDQVKIGSDNYSVINVNSLSDGAMRVATLQRA